MFLLAPGLSGYAFEGAGAETKLGFKAHSHILRHVCGFGLNYVLTATPKLITFRTAFQQHLNTVEVRLNDNWRGDDARGPRKSVRLFTAGSFEPQ